VEQACSQLGRELIRVNITVETDEDDLLGGFRLVSSKKHTIKCNDYMISKYNEWKNICNK
jgi:MoxR-like ATPase